MAGGTEPHPQTPVYPASRLPLPAHAQAHKKSRYDQLGATTFPAGRSGIPGLCYPGATENRLLNSNVFDPFPHP